MRAKPTSGTKTCAGCRREVTTPEPNRGHPYGWYQISISVPPELSSNGQAYRWVGTYCSPQCIADSLPYIKEMRVKFRQDFDYE